MDKFGKGDSGQMSTAWDGAESDSAEGFMINITYGRIKLCNYFKTRIIRAFIQSSARVTQFLCKIQVE